MASASSDEKLNFGGSDGAIPPVDGLEVVTGIGFLTGWGFEAADVDVGIGFLDNKRAGGAREAGFGAIDSSLSWDNVVLIGSDFFVGAGAGAGLAGGAKDFWFGATLGLKAPALTLTSAFS